MRTISWINLSPGILEQAQDHTPDCIKISQVNFQVRKWNIYRWITEYVKPISLELGRLVEGLW